MLWLCDGKSDASRFVVHVCRQGGSDEFETGCAVVRLATRLSNNNNCCTEDSRAGAMRRQHVFRYWLSSGRWLSDGIPAASRLCLQICHDDRSEQETADMLGAAKRALVA